MESKCKTCLGCEYQATPEYKEKMSEDKKQTTEEKTQQFCSFCGKSVYEVKKLVSGRDVCICDECINLCNDIMADDKQTQIKKDTERGKKL